MRISRRTLMAMLPGAALSQSAALRPRPTKAIPLLTGNWADPTILKDGDDYYMTHSSFAYQPGLLVWHSKDLRTWRPISRAVVNQKGSIWAPEMIKHDERYFIYYPATDPPSASNWVVTADSPAGPWSPAQPIGARHIDPGHIVGSDGKRYIHLSGGRMVEMSDDGLRALSEPRQIYDGWPIPDDWAIECVCLESPKLLFRDGWYYLTSAQGGTLGPSTSHMVIAARSRGPNGPWENSPYNPVIRTWSREEEWWSKGHGTIFEGPGGQWYCVLHGVMNGFRTLGRPTLIEPIEWTSDGWYRVPERWPAGWDRPVKAEMPMSDDFTGQGLGIQWQFYEHFDESRFRLGGGVLTLAGRGSTAGASRPLAVMPMHRGYEIEVHAEAAPGVTAGLMLFASPTDYIGLALTPEGKLLRVQEGYRRYGRTDEPSLGSPAAALRIVNDRQDVRFYQRTANGGWKILQPSMEVSAGGALRPALFAYGSGKAKFTRFRYTPLEG